MKEIMRQYGAAVITALITGMLFLVIMQLPLGSATGVSKVAGFVQSRNETLTSGREYNAFDMCWRNP